MQRDLPESNSSTHPIVTLSWIPPREEEADQSADGHPDEHHVPMPIEVLPATPLTHSTSPALPNQAALARSLPSTPPSASAPPRARRIALSPHEQTKVQQRKDLLILESDVNVSTWLTQNAHEPRCGDLDAPALADRHGVRGQSCLSAFVDHTREDGVFGCRHATCHAYAAKSLEEAVTHQRSEHFNHRPFVCAGMHGTACGRRFFSASRLQSHRKKYH